MQDIIDKLKYLSSCDPFLRNNEGKTATNLLAALMAEALERLTKPIAINHAIQLDEEKIAELQAVCDKLKTGCRSLPQADTPTVVEVKTGGGG